MPDSKRASIGESLDMGYDVLGVVKYHEGQYGCAIATRNEPFDVETLDELRVHSEKRTAAYPNEPYTYEFGQC